MAPVAVLPGDRSRINGSKPGVRRMEGHKAVQAELEVLHGVPVAVVEIGADEVGLPLVDVSALHLEGAVPHPVVHGGGLDAVPVDGVGRRPLAVGMIVANRPPGRPVGGRREYGTAKADSDTGPPSRSSSANIKNSGSTAGPARLSPRWGRSCRASGTADRIRDGRRRHSSARPPASPTAPDWPSPPGADRWWSGMPVRPMRVRSSNSGVGGPYRGGSNILVHNPSAPVTGWREIVLAGFGE